MTFFVYNALTCIYSRSRQERQQRHYERRRLKRKRKRKRKKGKEEVKKSGSWFRRRSKGTKGKEVANAARAEPAHRESRFVEDVPEETTGKDAKR